MLQAVLDTNIWLATHVVCITIGYSAMFLAECWRFFTLSARVHPIDDHESAQSLAG